MLALSSQAHAITKGVAPAEDDLRFDAIAALSFAHWLGLDPTTGQVDPACGQAAGCQQNNWFCNATLIAPNAVITAKHCVDSPTTQYALRFRRHLDGGLGTLDGGPASYHHVLIDQWVYVPFPIDMLFATLKEPVSHVMPIGALTEGAAALPQGIPVLHAGWGKQGPYFNQGPLTELRLCHTTLRSALSIGLNTTVDGLEPLGCQVNMHDSGSPVVVAGLDGTLRIIGVTTAVGGGSSLQNLPGPPTLPLVNTPFDGEDRALALAVLPKVLAPGQAVTVSVHVADVGATPSLEPVIVDLWLERAGGGQIELGTVKAVAVPVDALGIEVSLTPPVATSDQYGSYQIRGALTSKDGLPDALPWNDDATSMDYVGITPNPADVVTLWQAVVFTPQSQLLAFAGLVVRSDGAVDVAVSSPLLNLLDARLATPLPAGGVLTMLGPLGKFDLAPKINSTGFTVTLTTAAMIKKGSAFEDLRTGPSIHLMGLYVGADTLGNALYAHFTGAGYLTLYFRTAGVCAFDEGLTGAPLESDPTGLLITFQSDESTAKALWDPAKATFRLTLAGGANVPAGNLWLQAPLADLDEDGAPGTVDCEPDDPFVYPDAIELCNAIDDDCDGAVDDVKEAATACGVGACASAGVLSCVSGVMTDTCLAGTPSLADTTCDGQDDDCNGAVDDGATCRGPTDDVGGGGTADGGSRSDDVGDEVVDPPDTDDDAGEAADAADAEGASDAESTDDGTNEPGDTDDPSDTASTPDTARDPSDATSSSDFANDPSDAASTPDAGDAESHAATGADPATGPDASMGADASSDGDLSPALTAVPTGSGGCGTVGRTMKPGACLILALAMLWGGRRRRTASTTDAAPSRLCDGGSADDLGYEELFNR